MIGWLTGFFPDKYLSRWLVPILAAIILLLLVVAGWAVWKHRQDVAQWEREKAYAVRQASWMERKNSLQNTLIRTTSDSIGRLISTISVIEVDRNTVRALSQTQGSFINDQLRQISKDQRELKKIARTMKGATTIHVEAKGDFLAVMQDTVILTEGRKYRGDSVRYDSARVFAKTFNYKDKSGFFEIKGTVSNDTMYFSPVFRDKINFVSYRQKIPKRYFFDWFRPKQTVINYKSENPHSTLLNFQQVIVTDK